MRLPFFVASTLALVCAVSNMASAQTGSSVTIAGAEGDTLCHARQWGSSSSATCEQTQVGAMVASAAAAASSVGQSASALASVGQLADTGAFDFMQASAKARVRHSISFIGTPNEDDFLVFHFALTETALFENVSGDALAAAVYAVTLDANDFGSSYAVTALSCGCFDEDAYFADGYFDDNDALVAADLYAPVDGIGTNATYRYIYHTLATALYLGDEEFGAASVTGGLAAHLTGIDLYRYNEVFAQSLDNYRGSVVFDEFGEGVLTLDESESPEPASLVLLASGLCAMAGLSYRRRRATASTAA